MGMEIPQMWQWEKREGASSSQFAWHADKPTVRQVVPAIAPLPKKWYFPGTPKNRGNKMPRRGKEARD